MSTTELPPAEQARPSASADAPSEPHRAGSSGASELTDTSFVHLLKRGALFGTPVVMVGMAAMAWLAVPGNPRALLAMVWPALLGGWYIGTIIALGVHELGPERLRHRHRARR